MYDFFLGNLQEQWLGLWTISYPSKAQSRKVGEKSINKVRFGKKEKENAYIIKYLLA